MTQEQVKEWILLGKKLYQQHDFDRAEDMLRRAARQNPNYADVQNMLGVIYHAAGRFGDAIKSFEAALKINPHYSEALLNLAVLYNDLGQYKSARTLYDRLRTRSKTARANGKKPGKDREIEPILRGKLTNMHADIADIYFGLGLYAEAIAEYRQALGLSPMFADIQTKLGIALREHGDHPESVKILREACKPGTKYHHARVQLGVTLYAMGKTAEAKKAWNETLKNDPNNAAAKMYLSLCTEE